MADLLSDEEIEARLDGSDWKREGEHIVRDWEFKDFLSRYPEVSWRLMQTLSRRLREAQSAGG